MKGDVEGDSFGNGTGPLAASNSAQDGGGYFKVAARAHIAVMRSFMRRQLDRAMEPLC